MSGSQKNMCFYSPNCKWSIRFLEALRQTPYKGMFHFLNVNDQQVREKFRWLKKVPTLVVVGEQEPRTDESVMNWLFEQKLRDGQKNPPPPYTGAGRGNNSVPGQNANVAGNAEPEAWVASEMSGNTRIQYTSMDDSDVYTKTGNYEIFDVNAPQNLPQGQGTRTGSMITNTIGSIQNRSRNEELFDKQMESYLKNRDTGVNRPPARL